MSQSSFPCSKHIALLRRKIEERIRLRGDSLEVAERGLNQLKCQYKFGLRTGPNQEWVEIGIHFQVADRLETTGSVTELNRTLDGFLNRHFQGSDP
jgi:hypothetical protein